MSTAGALEALKALHVELLAILEHRFENVQVLERLLLAHAEAFRGLLDKPSRAQKSRDVVLAGKLQVDDEEYQINADFIENTLKLADEVELDEVEAAKLLLDVSDDALAHGHSLLEKGIINFHFQREHVLSCMRLCIEIASDETLDSEFLEPFGAIVNESIFGVAASGRPQPAGKKIVPKCLDAMRDIKTWIQRDSEKIAAMAMMSQGGQPHEFQETIEFSRKSLATQHELLAVILCAAIKQHHADVQDFHGLIASLKKADRYDQLLIQLFPALGAFISMFGSTEGGGDFQSARALNEVVCKKEDEDSWTLVFLRGAVHAWWIAEYSGWYLDANWEGVDMDKEDEERSKQFMEALKHGAFDFILSVAADCQTAEWQDPARYGMRQWLMRTSPALNTDSLPFHPWFRTCLMVQLEVFIDAAISNIPDILRRLRSEEDEQRQLSQTHQQGVDLERFLMIVSYAYENRPEASMTFWDDPDSNLAGFLAWASKRASTPLVSAFCEMLQALSDGDECATAAHRFLLDESVQATGKLRRTQSLTWNQIWNELEYFTNKLRVTESAVHHSTAYRGGKHSNEAETEPEMNMMLECYLRLMAKLASQSELARKYLQDTSEGTLHILHELSCHNIPPRLRSCIFYYFKALLTDKSLETSYTFWMDHEAWMSGHYITDHKYRRDPTTVMESFFDGLSTGFEQPNAMIQFLTALVAPVPSPDDLYDHLPLPENLGAKHRAAPGMDPYVDYVFGKVFARKTQDTADVNQIRVLRVTCLEFALTCLGTFNEDLIILGNDCNVAIDDAIGTSNLINYVRLHPFARVMEWMFNDEVLGVLFQTLHQDSAEVGSAPPNSPLVGGKHLAVEVMLKVMDLQATYLNLVRPIIKMHSSFRGKAVANTAYASFEDGLMNHLDLVVDLGRFCGVGHAPLTLACLKMLEKISTSTKIISAWNPENAQRGNRNKAIVALERNDEGAAIATSLSSEISEAVDPSLEEGTDNYMIKTFILDFLYECLKASPDRPTIAHLLLGFRCEVDSLSIDGRGAFNAQSSLFHSLLNVFLQLPYFDESKGMRAWLIALKHKILRVFQILWNAPLSSAIIMSELRETKFLFHALLGSVSISPDLRWDGEDAADVEFLLADASAAYIDFLAIRAMLFEYMGKELCSVSQSNMPAVRRGMFEALNGQLMTDDGTTASVPSVFDLYDFLLPVNAEDTPRLVLDYYKELDFMGCTEEDADSGLQYDLRKVKELLALRRREGTNAGEVATKDQVEALEKEEAFILRVLVFDNRKKQFKARRLKVLRAWTNLVLVMFHSGELKGNAKGSFLLQTLQTTLPSLDLFSGEYSAHSPPVEAFELAKLAKVVLMELDFGLDASAAGGRDRTLGTLVSDKVFQLFQISLAAISRVAGGPELRALYYGICCRYVTRMVDQDQDSDSPDRLKTVKAIRLYGDRFLNVACDDASGSDPNCQTAAMVLLGALVQLSESDDNVGVIETLNRLNFIAVLVDSLKTLHVDWLAVMHEPRSGARPLSATSEQYLAAKMALLLRLCQTRPGAALVTQANLFRALEQSGAFAADPELEIDAADAVGLERHYTLLASLARVAAATVLARGEHAIPGGRRFLTAHRQLVVHALKRSAGIGGGVGADDRGAARSAASQEALKALDERVQDLAEAFMILITATGYLDFESDKVRPEDRPRSSTTFFH